MPEYGNYLFYSTTTDSSYCDNYAELWTNGERITWDNNSGGNGQFYINWELGAGEVELRTYMNGHSSDEGTYTVHIEKVPEGYNNLDSMYIGGTSSSICVPVLTVDETKKYRFIAPVSNDSSTKVNYMFYSQLNTSSEGVELTASISLASEVSAYALGTAQTDNKGNFYNVAELTPGRPYIFSITNNGSADLSSTTYVYARQYTETECGSIGGSTQSKPTALNIAEGENWISYTAAEDGIYTFTVSDASDYGYMYLYKVEGSQLTQLPLGYNDYIYFNSQAESNAVNLAKGDAIVLRIYQSNYQALDCNVQASWSIWDITSVENGSNTIDIATDSSGKEGKVWLTFGNAIEEGTYTISTTYTSVTLKLYKDGEPVTTIPDNGTESEDITTENNRTVKFNYKPDDSAKYQLGITTTQPSVSLTITKETITEETPDEGGDTGNSGDILAKAIIPARVTIPSSNIKLGFNTDYCICGELLL